MTYADTAPARLATRLAFFSAGFALGAWAPLIPYVKGNVGANEAQFGLLLLCVGIGSVIAMPLTGWSAARRGARPMILLGGFGMAATLPLLALVHHPVLLAVPLVIFGASLGTLDVSMNVHGSEIERRENRTLMSGFHAQFSIGGFVGAAFSTSCLWLGLSIGITAMAAAAIILAAILLARPRLISARGHEPEHFAMPKGVVILLSLAVAIFFLVEGALLDWGALLVIDRKVFPTQSAGLGYIAFSIAMVLGRLTGDATVARFGSEKVLFAGGVVTVLGIATILLASSPALTLVGFAIVGLGAANVVPMLFSLTGRQNVMPPAMAIAVVSVAGYAGILLGPALIGFVADRTGLSVSFGILAALAAIVPLSARRLSRP